MQDREQIINFLLQSGDRKDAIIADLQKKVSVLEKQLADSVAQEPKE